MASKIGIYPTRRIDLPITSNNHNPTSALKGLPVKATEIIYQGCLVAYDPANSQAQSADPAMPATAIVVGVNRDDTVDNTAGAKGALTVNPEAGLYRLDNDGNVTAAHLYKRCRVIDDHTVGVPAGTDADRFAGIVMGLEGDYVWVAVGVELVRGPQTVTLTSTNGTAAGAADLAALKTEAEKIGDDVRALHAALVTAGLIAPAA